MTIQIMSYLIIGVALLLLLARFSDWPPHPAGCVAYGEANRVGVEEAGKRCADEWTVEPTIVPAKLSHIVVIIGYAMNLVRRRVAARETRQMLVDEYPRERLHSLRYSDLFRVCYGDGSRLMRGGHLHGVGSPNKTEFPPTWDIDKVAAALQAVAHKPDDVRQEPRGRWRAIGHHEGVKIVAIAEADGRIVSGWPLLGPRVQRNPPRARKRRVI